MSDLPGDTLLSKRHVREKRLPAFSFRNAPPGDLKTDIPPAPPVIQLPGGYRRIPVPGMHAGDALNQYEEWLNGLENGQCALNQFMSLQGAQQSVILNDFFLAQKKQKLPSTMPYEEQQLYAAFDGLTTTSTADLTKDAQDIVAQSMATGSLKISDKKKKEQFQTSWRKLSASEQVSAAEQYLQSVATGSPMSADDFQKLMNGFISGGDVTKVGEVIVAAVVLAALAYGAYEVFS